MDKNKNILIVDDSLINLEIARDFMEYYGFSVDTAENGARALDSVKRKLYSLVFMDVQMPVMDGLTATTEIRKYEKSSGRGPVTIIALTSETSDGIEQRCIDSGMDDFLPKPFTHQEIHHKISHLLTDSQCVDHNNTETAVLPFAGAQVPIDKAIEDISHLSHWLWYFSSQTIQFTESLQRHFDFSLRKITSLDSFIESVEGVNMKAAIDQCISTGLETNWQQVIARHWQKQLKHLLFRFRVVVCNDNYPVLVGTVQDITFIKHMENRNLELASQDYITGLSSRFKFIHQLDYSINHAASNSQNIALLYIKAGILPDTDYTKIHKSEIHALHEFSRILREVAFNTSFTCRLKGDEFCVALININNKAAAIKDAKQYIDRLIACASSRKINNTRHLKVGLAIYPFDGVKAAGLVDAAAISMQHSMISEEILYLADEYPDAVLKYPGADIEHELLDALDNNKAQLQYNPNISLDSGEITSLEACLHWSHTDTDTGSLISEHVLAGITSLELMIAIDLWTIRQVCKQLSIWAGQGVDDKAVAITVFLPHFELDEFSIKLFNISNNAGISPSMIEIQLADYNSQNRKAFNETCQKLRALGFKVAIDDFGSGYSLLPEISDIRVDTLKIEKNYIQNLPHDIQSSIMLGTIHGLCTTRGLKIIAKGVDNNEQLQVLSALGCDMGQGSYFSPLIKADDLPALASHNFI